MVKAASVRVAATGMVCLLAIARAQEAGARAYRVEVQSETPMNTGGLSAELDDSLHCAVARAELQPDASFEFSDVPAGQYQIVISTPRGAVLYEGPVNVNAGNRLSAIPLRVPAPPRPPTGMVSVEELRHPPSRKAMQAFTEGSRLRESGEMEQSAAQLEKAIRFSPEYIQAHTDLAAVYIGLGRYEDAIRESSRAMQLGKPNELDLCNMAYSQLRLGRSGDAISSAGHALELQPDSGRAHFLLGVALAADAARLGEAVSHLEIAARSVSFAEPALDAVRKRLRTVAQVNSAHPAVH